MSAPAVTITDSAAEWPHVTSIIRAAGLIDVSHYTDADRDRGTIVHQLCEYHDQGDLDEECLEAMDPTAVARFAQWKRFLAEAQPNVLSIEERVVSRELRYQGRLDRRVRLGTRVGVLDIKGPSCEPWIGVQLAAYAHAVGGVQARWSLHLSDSAYKLIEWTDRLDWDVFRAALIINTWKESR